MPGRRLRPMSWVYLVIVVVVVAFVVVPTLVQAVAAGEWGLIAGSLGPLVLVLALASVFVARVRRQLAPPVVGQPHRPGAALDTAYFGLLLVSAGIVVAVPVALLVRDGSTDEIPSAIVGLACVAALPLAGAWAVRRRARANGRGRDNLL